MAKTLFIYKANFIQIKSRIVVVSFIILLRKHLDHFMSNKEMQKKYSNEEKNIYKSRTFKFEF